ncbi:MAG: ABC-2 type transport system ATP-binding protein [Planctomycetota bacterium]
MSAIDIRDLTKCFGSRTVVEKLCLKVEKGSIYGLLGPNGSGKTTTLACALGLLRPTSGSSEILGVPASKIHLLEGRLSVVFDTAIALPGLSATQNLDYIRKLLGHSRGRSNEEVLKAVDLEEHARAKVRSLSLGQAKRLAIAGALLGEPELLVLDEPLSGLDTMAVRRMLRLFRKLRDEGMTLMLSSHRLLEMQTVITHAGILFGGKIVKHGTLDEVIGLDLNEFAITVDKADKAKKAIATMKGAEWLSSEALGNGLSRVVVRTPGIEVGAMNRILVNKGVAVSAIGSSTHSLQTVFESIVDEKEAEEVGL